MLPVLFGVFIVLGLSAYGVLGQSPPAEAPRHWVAFRAVIEQRDDQARLQMSGLVARSSDGSYARVVHPVGKDVAAVTIHNVATRTAYFLDPGATAWRSHPMVLPSFGYRPFDLGRLLNVLESRFDPALNLTLCRSDRAPVDEEVGLAPALNYLPVRTERQGWVETLTQLEFVEPDPSLFVPPPGARIVQHTKPAGIVFSETPRP
jgi:hypothetical protein